MLSKASQEALQDATRCVELGSSKEAERIFTRVPAEACLGGHRCEGVVLDLSRSLKVVLRTHWIGANPEKSDLVNFRRVLD